MKNWQKAAIAVLIASSLAGCKAWACGCPMTGVQRGEPQAACCSLLAPANNEQQATSN